MSLKSHPIPAVPEETARVARLAFRKGNPWVCLRDQLGTIYQDESFAALFPDCGQPAEPPWRLALVSVMQYAEGLSDRQASDAVRSRIDWKYALSLELTDTGFDASVLSEFRTRLAAGRAEQILLDLVLKAARGQKLIDKGGKQRTDSTNIQAAIHTLNRLENVSATLSQALNTLAVAAPEWLIENARPEWVERYSRAMDEYRLPKDKKERVKLATQIGVDGHDLLRAIYAVGTPEWLRKIPEVDTLRQIWVQQYYLKIETVTWRTQEDYGLTPAPVGIHSPHDVQARYSEKRKLQWVGYKAHFTETCDQDKPRLITHVETTIAPVPDNQVLDQVHEGLKAKDLLPQEHLLDAGYVEAEQIVRSQQEYGVQLVGPPRPDTSWQAQAGQGLSAADFNFDWDRQQATCPAGRQSSSWQQAKDRYGNQQVKIKFSVLDCRACSKRELCTKTDRRIMTIHPEEEYLALGQARAQVMTDQYKKLYAKRAGIEGTLSQAVRRSKMRKARYVGLVKTHLQNVLTAAAINLVRLANWFGGVPLAKTRKSPFAKLMAIAPLTC